MLRETDGVTPLADAQRQLLVHCGKRRAASSLACGCALRVNRLTVRRTPISPASRFHRPPRVHAAFPDSRPRASRWSQRVFRAKCHAIFRRMRVSISGRVQKQVAVGGPDQRTMVHQNRRVIDAASRRSIPENLATCESSVASAKASSNLCHSVRFSGGG